MTWSLSDVQPFLTLEAFFLFVDVFTRSWFCWIQLILFYQNLGYIFYIIAFYLYLMMTLKSKPVVILAHFKL